MLVICCGMPRSGSTLQFNIAWKVAEYAGKGSKVEWRSGTDWEKAEEELRVMADDKKLYVIKMHYPPAPVVKLAETGKVRFIYVHRDIRDVVVSMKVKFQFSLSRAVRRISETLQLEEWLIQQPKNTVLVQDYETLLRTLPAAVEEVSNFLDAELSDEKISEIADELNINVAYAKSRKKKPLFEHLRRRLNLLFGRKIAFADDELMLHPEHVSVHKGETGIWKSALTDDELSIIEKKFSERINRGFHVK